MLEELQDGTSKPLKVQTVVKKRKRDEEPQLQQFVLKRAGGEGGRTRTAHIVSEFTAMAMYANAGLMVPCAALYTVKASCTDPTACSSCRNRPRPATRLQLSVARRLLCCALLFAWHA